MQLAAQLLSAYLTYIAVHAIRIVIFFPLLARFPLMGLGLPPHSRGLCFLDHTQRHTTVGRTPLDEWSATRRDIYLTTYNTLNRQTSTPPVGFEHTISAGERS